MNEAIRTLKAEVCDVLENNILNFWLNNMVDNDNGGFYGQMTGEGVLKPMADKGGILNARILWSFSAAYRVLSKKPHASLLPIVFCQRNHMRQKRLSSISRQPLVQRIISLRTSLIRSTAAPIGVLTTWEIPRIPRNSSMP